MNLVVMAAGMGSRFGGLKQIEPVGPNGEFIIDYSIYDAIKAGFDKVVFIIKEENYDIFKETIGKRIEKYIEVDYAFQKMDDIPSSYDYKDRVKPWGTAHAIYACRNKVKGDFMVINSDDFYGRDAFMQASKFFQENHPNEYAIVGYQVSNTMTEYGAVKRGICEERDGFLTKLIESSIERRDDKIVASPLDGSPSFDISGDRIVSMNMFCFRDDLFPYLASHLVTFLDDNKNDLSKCEYLIPDVVYQSIEDGRVRVRMLSTSSKWYGMTYREDLEGLRSSIQNMIDEDIYPNDLWR